MAMARIYPASVNNDHDAFSIIHARLNGVHWTCERQWRPSGYGTTNRLNWMSQKREMGAGIQAA